MVAIRKHLILIGQIGAPGVDQVNTRQTVLLRHLLSPQVLLDRHRVVSPALDRGIVADNHAVHATDAPHACDQAGTGRLLAVHRMGRQRGQLQKGRAGIEQHLHPLAWEQLASRHMPGTRGLTASGGGLGQLQLQVFHGRLHLSSMSRKVGRSRIESSLKDGHKAETPGQPGLGKDPRTHCKRRLGPQG